MRLPTFFSKKRGERRTGSAAWGSFGEGFFYAGLLAAGLFIGGLMLAGVAVPEWRINNHFVEVEGRLVGKGLARRTSTDLFGVRRQSWRPAVLLEYRAGDGSVRAWHAGGRGETTTDRSLALGQLDRWRLGQPVRCWYDPDQIETVVLKRGYNWWLWLLTLLLPGALVAFGAAGLVRAARAWADRKSGRQPKLNGFSVRWCRLQPLTWTIRPCPPATIWSIHPAPFSGSGCRPKALRPGRWSVLVCSPCCGMRWWSCWRWPPVLIWLEDGPIGGCLGCWPPSP